MAFLSWGYFVPDESWQSVEVAHRLIFGNGYLTWEWNLGLRSYLHPLLFAWIFQILKWIQLDTPFLVMLCPKICQGILSSIGDVAIIELFNHDPRKKSIFIAIYLSNWFMLYASSRTLINTLETCLTNIALAKFVDKDVKYVGLIATCFMVRPTTAIFWIPLVLFDLTRVSFKTFVFSMLPQALGVPLIIAGIDSYCYGRLTIVPWNFLQINLISSVSEQYGVHPWHWYLSNFLPALLMGLGILPMIKGIANIFGGNNGGLSESKMIIFSGFWTLIVYSLLGHKEHRFLMPLIPIILICVSAGFKKNDMKLKLFCIVNVILTLYLSLVHQSGPHAATRHLSTLKDSNGILFLTPCHGTQFYSHIHWNIPMKFLECPPNLGNDSSVKDNSDLFVKRPLQWISDNVDLSDFDQVVLFTKWKDILNSVLENNGLFLCETLFHTHFPDSNTSNFMLIYCRNKR